jgi:uncharacterized membrane protein YfcA
MTERQKLEYAILGGAGIMCLLAVMHAAYPISLTLDILMAGTILAGYWWFKHGHLEPATQVIAAMAAASSIIGLYLLLRYRTPLGLFGLVTAVVLGYATSLLVKPETTGTSPQTGEAQAVMAIRSDIAELLGRLSSLRDEGLITPTEFEAKKVELLSRA